MATTNNINKLVKTTSDDYFDIRLRDGSWQIETGLYMAKGPINVIRLNTSNNQIIVTSSTSTASPHSNFSREISAPNRCHIFSILNPK